jgi:hypothetical protein
LQTERIRVVGAGSASLAVANELADPGSSRSRLSLRLYTEGRRFALDLATAMRSFVDLSEHLARSVYSR